jgi:hypothetical protein
MQCGSSSTGSATANNLASQAVGSKVNCLPANHACATYGSSKQLQCMATGTVLRGAMQALPAADVAQGALGKQQPGESSSKQACTALMLLPAAHSHSHKLPTQVHSEPPLHTD